MPYYGGGDLFSRLEKHECTWRRRRRLSGDKKSAVPCMPLHEARFYIAEAHLALKYIHKLKIIFRDLKLENMVLSNASRATMCIAHACV